MSQIKKIEINLADCSFTAIRSSGPGGQHVNKVSTGILLSFDIQASSLLDMYKLRLLAYNDHRISESGVILIKSTQHRSQLKNKKEAIDRLHKLIDEATKPIKVRKKTKTPKAVKEQRLKNKSRKSEVKKMRQKPRF